MIHVIGAGWYGCYIAKELSSLGQKVELWEQADAIFSGASSKNQNRLHLGFHYPRNFCTRKQSREGFEKFETEFPELSTKIRNNVYAIASDSLLDASTYEHIFKYEEYLFEEFEPNFQNSRIEKFYRCEEKLIRHDLAKIYWENQGLSLNLGSPVVFEHGELSVNGASISHSREDIYIDCTWGALNPVPNYREELFITFLVRRSVENSNFDALTVMDGPFFSIFPYGDPRDKLFSLTHVKLGVVSTQVLSASDLQVRYEAILDDVTTLLPHFQDEFSLESMYISRKYKPESKSDSRVSAVSLNDRRRLITVLSGKIDTVFQARDQVIEAIKSL